MQISIVTICFENLEELQETIASVNMQSQSPYEHWIIDGSKNNLIKDWASSQSHPSYRFFVHEPDKGISDAFNKGVERCSGDVIHILNSGDTYHNANILVQVNQVFEGKPEIDWVHGQYLQYRGDVHVMSGTKFDPNQLWKGMRMVAHPTMFIKKKVYDEVGLFNLDKKVAMDYDFLVRIRNFSFEYIEQPLVNFAPGGTSSIQFERGLQEVKESYTKYIGVSFKLILWQFRQRVLNKFMSTSLGKTWFQWKNKSKQLV